MTERGELLKRYQRAISRCGGAYALLFLPEEVKDTLKVCTDIEAKTRMLEAIADRQEWEGQKDD